MPETDITEFLTEQYDEEERLAKAIAEWGVSVVDPYGYLNATIAEFIELNSPARVLADIAAKRRVLARHKPVKQTYWAKDTLVCEGCGGDRDYGPHVLDINECPELRDAAAVYADRPGYNPDWAIPA